MMNELQDTARAVLAQIGPAVVRIGRDGRGSGMVGGDDLLVTNAHNLRGRETTVTFADGRIETATVVAADLDRDLAVLGVGTSGLAVPRWAGRSGNGDGDIAAPVTGGTVVFALAGGPSGTRISFGMVSSVAQAFSGPRGRRIRGGIEHTAPLPRGSSGGPLVGIDGAVIGLNTHRVAEGLYLAQPAGPEMRSRLADLSAGNAPLRRVLGVVLAPSDVAARLRRSVGLEPAAGLLVRSVVDGSPAAQAGLAEGDLIQRAGDVEVKSAEDLHDALDALEGSGPAHIDITLLRGTSALTVRVDLPAATS